MTNLEQVDGNIYEDWSWCSNFDLSVSALRLQFLTFRHNHLGISGYDGSMVPGGDLEPAPDMNSSYWARAHPQRLKGELTSKLHQVNRLMPNTQKFNICYAEKLYWWIKKIYLH